MSESDPRKIIGVTEYTCESRRGDCQERITGQLRRIEDTTIAISHGLERVQRDQASHIARHEGEAAARAEVTGEHERTRSQAARIIGWIAAGLGVVGSIVIATWFLASQMQPDPTVLATAIGKVLKP